MENGSCIVGDVCYEGRGYCDEQSLVCLCSANYAQESDLVRVTECSSNIIVSKVLTSFMTVTWLFTVFGAIASILVMRRKELRHEIVDRRIILLIGLVGCCYVTGGVLTLTSEPYGRRSLGNETVTTIFYCVAVQLNWVFAIYKPLISVSGLSSSVFDHTGRGKDYYKRLTPFFLITTTAASLLPVALLFPSVPNPPILKTFYILYSVVGITVFIFVSYAFIMVRINIAEALAVNRELSDYQRKRLVRYQRRSSNALGLVMISAIGSVVVFLVLAISSEIAQRYSWVLVPIVLYFNGAWCLRHVVNSIYLSIILRRRENQTSSNYEGDGNDDQVEEKQGDEVADGSPRSLRQTSPFRSGRRHRRLRGIKRKPLELMSVVSERTAEGTVLFTQVDGLTEDGIREQSSEDAPRDSTRGFSE